MSVCPFARRTARVGRGPVPPRGLLPGSVLVKYSHTTASVDLDDAPVIGVAEQGVAVLETAREGDATHCAAGRELIYGAPAVIHATMRVRSASLGFGPEPMGNCFATGEAAQFQLGSCATATPQRAMNFSASTFAWMLKSRPVESCVLWHAVQ